MSDYTLLKTFGCLCYVTTYINGRHKFTHGAKSCVFLSYPYGYKGYKDLDLEFHSVLVSRNVIFYEKKISFKTCDLISKTVDMFPNIIFPLPAPLHFADFLRLYDVEHSVTSAS